MTCIARSSILLRAGQALKIPEVGHDATNKIFSGRPWQVDRSTSVSCLPWWTAAARKAMPSSRRHEDDKQAK